jgi:hypothetical protein
VTPNSSFPSLLLLKTTIGDTKTTKTPRLKHFGTPAAINKMAPTKRTILVINPNTTEAMTDGLKPLIASLGYNPVS